MKNNPIGVLDSGLGGLTVLSAIIKALPRESFVYIGDSLNTPYGSKSEEEIYLLAKKLVEFLLEKKVKAIVVACNTITVSCLDRLRTDYPELPIIGTVPVVKTAAAISRNKRIGILSTTRTARSDYQKHLIEEFAHECTVFNHGTDALVPLIEQGEVDGEEIKKILQEVLVPFQKENIDTLALGCTHFPFLKTQIQGILGPDVRLLDSGGAIARQVKRVLEHNGTVSQEQEATLTIYTTGDVGVTKQLVDSTIEKKPITVKKVTL